MDILEGSLSLHERVILLLQVNEVGVLLFHLRLERLHSHQTLSLKFELAMSFNLRHLFLNLTNFLILLDFLFSVGDDVGSLRENKNDRYTKKEFTYSKVLLQLGIALLNSSQVAAKVPLTIGEYFILLAEVAEVTVTFSGLLIR
jgi:hypothetical protein